MTQGVGKRFARGERRVERLVDPLEPIRLEATGDRQCLSQKALRGSEQDEGVAVELPIVQKLHLVDAAEAGDAQQALRHLELQTRGVAEQDRRRPQQHSVAQQSESSQHVGGGSLLSGSARRPCRTASATVLRISAASRFSIDQPVAGWFSHRCSLCMRSISIRWYSSADMATVVFPTRR